MDKFIKNILKRIESEGYEAYIVGGYVRDKVLGKVTYDIDICTNALPKDLKNIFPINKNSNGYGGFNLKFKKYNIDITTYRKEIRYDKRKPVEIEYVSNLFEDIKRRDFTINSLCMDKNENTIDLLNGRDDLKNKIIKTIGNADEKFSDDPLRMLRAIRFASVLGFEIDSLTYKSIKKNYELVSTLSSERIKDEISKILVSPNYSVGLQLLNRTNISSIIGLKYDNLVYTEDILGMWAQIEICKCHFTKNEIDSINMIKKILLKQEINNYSLFNYGLYISLVAGDILGISRQCINKMYKNLPIKSMKDIDITGNEIIKLLNISPSKKISIILNDLKNKILNGELKNKKSDLKKYVMENYHE